MSPKYIRYPREIPPERQINYKRLIIVCAPLVIATALFVYFFQYAPNTQPGKKAVTVEKSTVSYLYPGSDGKLSEKTIEVDKSSSQRDRGNIIIGELKKAGLVPEGLLLQEMVTDGEGIMYLNFTRDLLEGSPGRSDDIMLVYSIANSFLASFRYTRKVQFLIDWKPVYTLRGTVYTYLPIEFNKQVMED